MAAKQSLTQNLRDRGFDLSYVTFDGGAAPRCSQCEALVINGVPTHETGCPNARRYRCGECGEWYHSLASARECCNPVEEDEHEGVCRTCGDPYDLYADGYDGECPSCADKRDQREHPEEYDDDE